MGYSFAVYFENEPLRQRIEPLLQGIPAVFGLEVYGGLCEIEYPWPDDPNWCDFPFPVLPGTVYIFSGEGKAARFRGGHFFGRVAAMVLDADDAETITLRIWHELLHATGQPADDMETDPSAWLSPLMTFFFMLTCRLPFFINYWQRCYYTYLTERLDG